LDPVAPPVRRSPLESVLAALGARWVDDVAHWPASYGDLGAEAAAVARGAGIADLGPIDKFVVRGPRTRSALDGAGIAFVAAEVTSAGDGTQAWCLADDEVIVLAPPPAMSDLVTRLRTGGAAVTDVSSGFSVLRLVGSASPAILERACPVDLSPRAVAEGRIVAAAVVNVRMMVARQDLAGVPGYTVLVARDLAEYAWEALLGIGRPLGLTPVGVDAVTSR
jgi:heterotetrameric sarcosine oxidase gamma subunit